MIGDRAVAELAVGVVAPGVKIAVGADGQTVLSLKRLRSASRQGPKVMTSGLVCVVVVPSPS